MENLTNRENEVLDLILEEKSNLAISKVLGLSIKTIESHRKSIYLKLGVDNVVGLVKRALEKNSIK